MPAPFLAVLIVDCLRFRTQLRLVSRRSWRYARYFRLYFEYTPHWQYKG